MKVNASVNMDKRNIAVGFTAEKEEGESDFFDSLFKKFQCIEPINFKRFNLNKPHLKK